MNVTISCDLRGRFGAVRDQKTRPTCLAFAISDAHGSLHSPFLPLSVEYLYYHAVQLMVSRDPHAGINIQCGLKSLKSPGQPGEVEWPYQAKLPADLSQWAPPVGCALYSRDSSMSRDDFAKICLNLEAGRPVVMCMELSESFYTPLADGTLPRKVPDPKTGNHAVIAVGYGAAAAERYLLVRNSWGTSWGLGGHAFLGKDYVNQHVYSTSIVS